MTREMDRGLKGNKSEKKGSEIERGMKVNRKKKEDKIDCNISLILGLPDYAKSPVNSK